MSGSIVMHPDLPRMMTRAHRRSFAGVLGGVLYMASGVIVLATTWLLPHGIHTGRLTVIACLAITVGSIVPWLPWHTFNSRGALVLVVVAQTHLAVAGWLVPGAMEHYLSLYVLSYLYLGMTQPPRTALYALPVTVASFLVATQGELRDVVNFAVMLPVGVVAAEVLARLLRREERHAASLRELLDAARAIVRATTSDEAAAVTGELVQSLLGTQIVAVLVADMDRPTRYVARMVSDSLAELGEIAVDIEKEQTGVAIAVRSCETLIVDDAQSSAAISRKYARATNVGSIAYVPLFDDDTPVGAITVGWRQTRNPLGGSARAMLELLAAHVGPVLGRLRDRERLVVEAETDLLTGLPNRRAFERAMDNAGDGDAIAILDLDEFKSVNDREGHAAGDRVLRLMGACLSTEARGRDCVARIGGEEFALILTSGGDAGAFAFLQRLRRRWAESGSTVTFSAGVATVQPGEAAIDAMHRADLALYDAKANGRNRDSPALH